MTPRSSTTNTSWPAAAAIFIIVGALTTSTTTTFAFLPVSSVSSSLLSLGTSNQRRPTCTIAISNNGRTRTSCLLPVAATPVTPTVNAANSTSSNNNNSNNHNNNHNNNYDDLFRQYKDLHQANMALDALAVKCTNPATEPVIKRADECQSQWEAMHRTSLDYLKPDTVSFNTVLKAWSKCSQALADHQRATSPPKPNYRTTVAHVVPAASSTDHQPDGGGGMQQHVDHHFDIDSFTTLSTTQATQETTTTTSDHPQVYTAKDAAERVTLLLLSQEQDYENGIIDSSARPDTLSYNEAIGAWARCGVAEAPHNAERLFKRMLEHDYIKPDGLSYNSVVDAWAVSGKPESLHKVKHIFQHMEQLYNAANQKDNNNNHDNHENNNNDNNSKHIIIKPTIRTVNSIIKAHGKRVQELVEAKDIDAARQVAREAEGYLDLMKERYEQTKDPDHMPDVTTYTTLMDTYGRCGRYGSTMRAKALLQELKDLYQETQNPKLKPNVRTYTSLITAWSKTRSPDSPTEAERVLAEMRESDDPDLQPNAKTFTSVINAWSRSSDHTKAQRSLKLLQTMKELHKTTGRNDLKPTLVSYNSALDACARCQGDLHQQTDALKIAFAVFKAIQQDNQMEANSVTYANLLRACSFLLQPGEERNNVAKVVFEKAKKAGMIDGRVMVQLKKTAGTPVVQELLDGFVPLDRQGTYIFSSIPPNWSRNVR